MSSHGRVLRDDADVPLRLLGMTFDITESKRAEEIFRRYELLASHSRDIILFVDFEGGGILEANEAAAEAYGFTRDELLQMSVHDLRAPETQPLAGDQMAEAAAGGILFETVHKHRDGSRFPVEVSSRGANFEGKRCLISIVRDITERKRVEREIRESRAKLQAALASMTDAVFISDAEGRFVDFNDAFATFHKFGNKHECLKTLAEYPDILDVYLDDGQLAPLEQWAVPRALRGEAVTNAEYTLRRKDTGECWVGSYSFGPIRDADGAIVGSVVAGRDVTERKRMEDELRRSHDELELRVQQRTAELKTTMSRLEESNRALRDFASIAAHDLREPLRKVKTFGNMVRDKCGDALGEQGRDYLDRVLDANRRMDLLLAALLEYSRLATRANPFEEVELSKIVREVLSDLEVRIEQTEGRVLVGELPVIHADPMQMRQLFQNLIGNALKFHKESEKPIVRISSGFAGDGHLQILVEDNGIGFSEEYLEKIFTPFQRLHGKSSRFEGTGMGLAICKKIAERHGGSITAASRPEEGATFIVTLPAKIDL